MDYYSDPTVYPALATSTSGAGVSDREVGAYADASFLRANNGTPGGYYGLYQSGLTQQDIGWFNLPQVKAALNEWANSGMRMGWLVENFCDASDATRQYYADADDIVRRASGAYAASSGYNGAQGIATSPSINQSRPVILNRSFRSVAEMSYAFRDSPWKNIDFFTPETGDAALLDAFCLNDSPTPLVAGKVSLNTRQPAVIKAVLAGANKNVFNTANATSGNDTIGGTELDAIAAAVIARTSGTNAWEGPLVNISELAGKLIGKNVAGLPAGDSSIYSYTIPVGSNRAASSIGTWSYTSLGALIGKSYSDIPSQKIQRFRESAVRALVDSGQCRVWNLMIDLVAQTGRYPRSASGISDFLVEGERRLWVHVAIDRMTGEVLDCQVEVVTE